MNGDRILKDGLSANTQEQTRDWDRRTGSWRCLMQVINADEGKEDQEEEEGEKHAVRLLLVGEHAVWMFEEQNFPFFFIFFLNLIRYRLVLDEGQERLINPTPASEPRERVITHIESCNLLYTVQFIDYDIKLIRKEITFLDIHTYMCLYILPIHPSGSVTCVLWSNITLW